MKKSLHKIILILCSILAFSANTYASKHSGGGDPQQIEDQIKNQPSPAQKLIDEQKKSSEQNSKPHLHEEDEKALPISELRAQVEIIELFSIIFDAIKYPFSSSFQKNVNIEQTLFSLFQATDSAVDPESGRLKYPNFSIDNSLMLNGTPITFISDPENKSLTINFKRYKEQENQLKLSSIIGVIFHEGLRLQNIEGSNDYQYSGEFALAMRDALELPMFWDLVENSKLVSACNHDHKFYADISSLIRFILKLKISPLASQSLKKIDAHSKACQEYFKFIKNSETSNNSQP